MNKTFVLFFLLINISNVLNAQFTDQDIEVIFNLYKKEQVEDKKENFWISSKDISKFIDKILKYKKLKINVNESGNMYFESLIDSNNHFYDKLQHVDGFKGTKDIYFINDSLIIKVYQYAELYETYNISIEANDINTLKQKYENETQKIIVSNSITTLNDKDKSVLLKLYEKEQVKKGESSFLIKPKNISDIQNILTLSKLCLDINDSNKFEFRIVHNREEKFESYLNLFYDYWRAKILDIYFIDDSTILKVHSYSDEGIKARIEKFNMKEWKEYYESKANQYLEKIKECSTKEINFKNCSLLDKLVKAMDKGARYSISQEKLIEYIPKYEKIEGDVIKIHFIELFETLNDFQILTYQNNLNNLGLLHNFFIDHRNRLSYIFIFTKNQVEIINKGISSDVVDFKINDVFYTGKLINGKLEGKGIMRNDNFIYNGNFVNGLYDGNGEMKIHIGDFTAIYNGQFKEGKMNGFGEYKLFQKVNTGYMIENWVMAERTHFKGNFVNNNIENGVLLLHPIINKYNKASNLSLYKVEFYNGVRSTKIELKGKFSFGDKGSIDLIENELYQSNGYYRDYYLKNSNYAFSHLVKLNVTNNTLEIVKVIKDEIDDFWNFVATQRVEESARDRQLYIKYQQEQCNKCTLDWSESNYPREEDNFLWPGVSHKKGVIVMKNGEKYEFDYKDGKCMITNGWFSSDIYFNNFKEMLVDFITKCKNQWCK